MLLDTHNPYKPAVIDWPPLDSEARDRLVGLPIWDIAVQTEGKAKLRVASYAARIADPLLREAVALDAFEEGRHKEVLAKLVEAYGIRSSPSPTTCRRAIPEWALMVTGFSECIDSFFAFGLFARGPALGLLPAGAGRHLRTGDAGRSPAHPVLCQLGGLASPQPRRGGGGRGSGRRVAAVWVFLVGERIGLARGIGASRTKRRRTTTSR